MEKITRKKKIKKKAEKIKNQLDKREKDAILVSQFCGVEHW